MARKDLIFFGVLMFWMLLLLFGVLFFQDTLKMIGDWFNVIPIVILLAFIIPRHFSKRYNKWIETDPFKKK